MTNNIGKFYNIWMRCYLHCNGIFLSISHIGNSYLDTGHSNLKLKDVLEIRDLKNNFLSIGQLTNDYAYTFGFLYNSLVVIRDLIQRSFAEGHKQRQLHASNEGRLINMASRHGLSLLKAFESLPR